MIKKPRSASRPGRGRSSKTTRAEESQGAQEALQGPPAREAPDAEFRPTAEILEARDRYRWEQER